MIDIREGDVLVYGAKEYPIRAVSDWMMSKQSSSSFARMATLTVSTKRSTSSGGKRLAASTNVTGLKATPFDPASENAIRSAQLTKTIIFDTPIELLQTFITDGTGFVHLLIEETK